MIKPQYESLKLEVTIQGNCCLKGEGNDWYCAKLQSKPWVWDMGLCWRHAVLEFQRTCRLAFEVSKCAAIKKMRVTCQIKQILHKAVFVDLILTSLCWINLNDWFHMSKVWLQKHSLAIVYRNRWLNWFPEHHPDRPYRPNCSNQIGRSRIRSFVFAMFSSSHA